MSTHLRPFLRFVMLAAAVSLVGVAGVESAERPPNVVLIFADDLGYGDLGCYGAKGYTTPHLDRLAAEGVRMTDFLTPAAVCSASRAALLSGCYPQRLSILGALGPNSKTGIRAAETLLPELLRKRGYATAVYGKWHLGDSPEFLPKRHGFDDYFGLPYSNDMWPFHPTHKSFPPLPLIDGDRTIETNPDQTQLTTWYTERAVKFIEAHRERPFFLYVPHSMPHVPLFVSDKFKGRTERGLYGDVIAEIDWSVGRILDALQRYELADDTLVWFTSDNGPWLSYGEHAGSAGPLREGKGTTWEGGQRVPSIVRWPKAIPAGRTCDELASTIDVLPTIARLTGAVLPELPIDGHDIRPLLEGRPDATSPHEAFYYYWGYRLEAVRSGSWKLHFPHDYRSLVGPGGKAGRPVEYKQAKIGRALFNLKTDVGEQTDVSADHPEVVARLERLAERARADLGDELTKRKGAGVRPAGRATAP